MQARHLFGGVDAVPGAVALGARKAIATLPHTQRVFGQAGVALDGGNGQALHQRDFKVMHGEYGLQGKKVASKARSFA